MTGVSDPVPAVREADARGRTAELFDEIRQTLGVPYVNLVWRHLATIPGGLEWTWGVVRPLYRGAELPEAASVIRDGIDVGGIGDLPPFLFDAVGIGAAERCRIDALIASYNHVNGLALVALMAARAALSGRDGISGPEGRGAERISLRGSADWVDFPRLPGLDELPAHVHALVLGLDGYGRVGDTPVVASLYRHLAHWPGFLALAWLALRPAQEDGRLAAGVRMAVDGARRAGRELPHGIGPPGVRLDIDTHNSVEAGLTEFTERAIGRMVVMGACLRRLIPDPAGDGDRGMSGGVRIQRG
ncbi:hypothetical protein [Arenibaculum pallidiluteum]|uniref:hypothetical protein n=1 Tax=Arenibaculum pallidiluteum TaxID=2812559 RepID=UPI001A96DEAA|nr:hypothetical protein [Arenibaculum pallidiluteum]